MGETVLQNPKDGSWVRCQAGIIFNGELRVVNLNPVQGPQFLEAVASVPQLRDALFELHALLASASQLLADVVDSPSSEWSGKVNMLRKKVGELELADEEKPVSSLILS